MRLGTRKEWSTRARAETAASLRIPCEFLTTETALRKVLSTNEQTVSVDRRWWRGGWSLQLQQRPRSLLSPWYISQGAQEHRARDGGQYRPRGARRGQGARVGRRPHGGE